MVVAFLFCAVWFVQAQKNLPDAPNAPAVGTRAPEFTLPDMQGNPVALRDLLGASKAAKGQPALLLIFYRGYW
jgi:hypothetical protein